jgi:hypothetical protein
MGSTDSSAGTDSPDPATAGEHDEQSEHSGPPQAVITIAALAAGLVAHKLVSAGWTFVRGGKPNKDDSPLPELLIFAAVSAATVAVARNWASHSARRHLST